MNDTDWIDLGYRFHKSAWKGDGLWQKKLWYPDGSERSDSLGYLTWEVYKFPDRTGYQATADLDMSDGPMGIRRMLWNPSVVTPDIVRMVEREYRRLATLPDDDC